LLLLPVFGLVFTNFGLVFQIYLLVFVK